jgi:hypothetical protein
LCMMYNSVSSSECNNLTDTTKEARLCMYRRELPTNSRINSVEREMCHEMTAQNWMGNKTQTSLREHYIE